MKTLCAWCGVVITDGALIAGRVSHGICRACAARMEAEMEKEIR